MKNFILTSVLLFSISFGFSQTDSSSQIKSQVEKIVKLDSKELPANMQKNEMVLFSFNILANGSINVIDMNYSSQEIKDAVLKKLSEAMILNNGVSNKIHYYKVSFKKL